MHTLTPDSHVERLETITQLLIVPAKHIHSAWYELYVLLCLYYYIIKSPTRKLHINDPLGHNYDGETLRSEFLT